MPPAAPTPTSAAPPPTRRAAAPGPRDDMAASRVPLAGLVAMGGIWGALAAVMPDLRARTGASDAELGLAFLAAALVAVAAMLAAPAIGAWLDRRGPGARRGALAPGACTAAMVAAALLPGLATQVWHLALALGVLAAASGVADVLLNGRVAALEAARARPLMNLNHAAYSLAFFAVAVASGLARDAGLGAGAVLTVLAAALVPLVVVTWDARGAGVAVASSAADGRAALPPVAGLWLLVALGGGVMMLASLLEAGTETWSALHLERTLGAGPALGALGPAMLGLCMGIGRLAGQGLSRRLAPGRLMQLGAGIAGLGALAATLAPGPMVALGGIAALGLGASVLVPTALSLVGAAVPAERRTALIARAYALGFVGYVAAPALMGLIAHLAGLRWSFALLAAGALAALALAPALSRRAGR
ncbi:MAG: MFS transporter [Alkalilacustris sp.]